jgi:hypothetical protein
VIQYSEEKVKAAGVGAGSLAAVWPGGISQRALAILRRCRRVTGAGQRVLVIEWVISQGREGDTAKLLDLATLVSPGGKIRTREECAALFAATGFRLASIHPTCAGEYVIEVTPALVPASNRETT